MRDYIELGSSPSDEDCVQVSDKEDYIEKMRCEVMVYKNYLQRLFKPEQSTLSIKGFPHDFGTYYEVIAYFESGDQSLSAYEGDEEPPKNKSMDEAFNMENNSPARWDDIAIEELKTKCGIERRR
jgi:hypothetical protein